jgi:hypothetical protein
MVTSFVYRLYVTNLVRVLLLAFLPKKGEGYFVEENPPGTVSHLENISRCVEKGEHPSREQTYRKNFGNLKELVLNGC